MAAEIVDILNLTDLPAADPGTNVSEAFRAYDAGRAALTARSLEATDRALGEFAKAVELDGRFALAYAAIAESYSRKYSLTKDAAFVNLAQQNAERAVHLAPGSAEVHRSLAEVHGVKGEFEAGITELRRALEIDPSDASSYGILAIQYRNLGKSKEAEAAFLQSVALRPNYWNSYNALGSFYVSQGKYPEAEKAFRTEVQILPTQTMGFNNLGAGLILTDRCSEAVEVFRKSIAIKPSAGAYTNLGNCEFKERHYTAAAAAMEAAAKLNPKEHLLWRNLGDAYQMLPGREADARGSYQQALDMAEALLKVNPRDARALSSTALYRAKLDDSPRAQTAIAQTDRLESKDLSVIFNTAVASELTGQRKSALSRIKSALEQGFSMERVTSAPELEKLRESEEFRQLQSNMKQGATQ
ncbi:MAG: tetratricopeptide repeat protein [Acidobacteriota bacterium]